VIGLEERVHLEKRGAGLIVTLAEKVSANLVGALETKKDLNTRDVALHRQPAKGLKVRKAKKMRIYR
jgi:hypothetical protein